MIECPNTRIFFTTVKQLQLQVIIKIIKLKVLLYFFKNSVPLELMLMKLDHRFLILLEKFIILNFFHF